MIILTARDWQDVDVTDGEAVFVVDGYTLVFYIRVVFDGVGLVCKVMVSLSRSCPTRVYPGVVRSLDLSVSLVS